MAALPTQNYAVQAAKNPERFSDATTPVTHRASVVGAGQCGEGLAATARTLGRLLARNGFAVVTGGLGGVMAAASQGARDEGGLTIGLVPGDDRHAANSYVDVALATALGPMRNYLVVLNGDVVLAVGGGWGTLSEIALARKIGKPVVALDRWAFLDGHPGIKDLDGVHAAKTPEEAVNLAVSLTRKQPREA